MTDAGNRAGAPQVRASGRLVALDVLRGFTVMGMILVNSTAGVFYDARATVYAPLLHAHWDGLMVADVVFPAFLMMMGVSVPMALTRAKAAGGLDGIAARRIAVRTFRLVLIGFLLSNLYWFAKFDSGHWRLWGVLQRIGLVYGACALIFLACSPRVRMAIIVGLLVSYWPLSLLPSLDGISTDLWQRGHNFVASVDRVMLGAGMHNYVKGPEGYDPEGLLGTWPAIAHGLIGVAIGEYMMAKPGRESVRTLTIAGAAMLAGGLAWGIFFPIIKDIWSSSFVLVTCGITTLLLAGCHAWLDRDPARPLPWVAGIGMAFGMNAIAAYVLHSLTAGMVGWDVLLLPYRATLGILPPGMPALIPVLLYMAVIWAAMAWLRRKGWIIKV